MASTELYWWGPQSSRSFKRFKPSVEGAAVGDQIGGGGRVCRSAPGKRRRRGGGNAGVQRKWEYKSSRTLGRGEMGDHLNGESSEAEA